VRGKLIIFSCLLVMSQDYFYPSIFSKCDMTRCIYFDQIIFVGSVNLTVKEMINAINELLRNELLRNLCDKIITIEQK